MKKCLLIAGLVAFFSFVLINPAIGAPALTYRLGFPCGFLGLELEVPLGSNLAITALAGATYESERVPITFFGGGFRYYFSSKEVRPFLATYWGAYRCGISDLETPADYVYAPLGEITIGLFLPASEGYFYGIEGGLAGLWKPALGVHWAFAWSLMAGYRF